MAQGQGTKFMFITWLHLRRGFLLCLKGLNYGSRLMRILKIVI